MERQVDTCVRIERGRSVGVIRGVLKVIGYILWILLCLAGGVFVVCVVLAALGFGVYGVMQFLEAFGGV